MQSFSYFLPVKRRAHPPPPLLALLCFALFPAPLPRCLTAPCPCFTCVPLSCFTLLDFTTGEARAPSPCFTCALLLPCFTLLYLTLLPAKRGGTSPLLYLRYFALLYFTLLDFTTGEARWHQTLCLDVCQIVREKPFELILPHMLAVCVVCSSNAQRSCVSIGTFVLVKQVKCDMLAVCVVCSSNTQRSCVSIGTFVLVKQVKCDKWLEKEPFGTHSAGHARGLGAHPARISSMQQACGLAGLLQQHAQRFLRQSCSRKASKVK